jgi:hypothetical protein
MSEFEFQFIHFMYVEFSMSCHFIYLKKILNFCFRKHKLETIKKIEICKIGIRIQFFFHLFTLILNKDYFFFYYKSQRLLNNSNPPKENYLTTTISKQTKLSSMSNLIPTHFQPSGSFPYFTKLK